MRLPAAMLPPLDSTPHRPFTPLSVRHPAIRSLALPSLSAPRHLFTRPADHFCLVPSVHTNRPANLLVSHCSPAPTICCPISAACFSTLLLASMPHCLLQHSSLDICPSSREEEGEGEEEAGWERRVPRRVQDLVHPAVCSAPPLFTSTSHHCPAVRFSTPPSASTPSISTPHHPSRHPAICFSAAPFA